MTEEKQIEEKLPAEVRANMLSNEQSIFFNVALFEQAQRVATMFANSTMVPEHFRNNVGNCMIGLNYAARLQADPFMVLQCLYVVHGRPGIEGKLVEAAINASGKYSEPLDYAWLDPEDKPVERYTVLNHKDFGEFGCQAFSIDARSGKRVDGPKITWKLIKAEGWNDKAGSKWKTMPEMMFYYRAASWFGNKNCPELKLGMHTVEELGDMPIELTPKPNGSYGVSSAKKSVDEDTEGLVKQFDNTIAKLESVNQDNLNAYLSKSAEHFGKSIEEIKAEAVEDFDGFWKQFRIWEDSQSKESSPQDAALRAEFTPLRSQFPTWFWKNIERIKAASPAIKKELEIKWNNSKACEGEPFPLGEPPETTVDKATGEILDQPVTTEGQAEEEQEQTERNKARLNFLSSMSVFKNELKETAYFRVLMSRSYKEKNDVPYEKQDEVLAAMSSELDAQNAS